MELLLNILNKCGYIVDNKKNQIVDYSNNDIGILTCDKGLVTYSFSNGRKIIFDKTNNQVTIHMSNELDILFKLINNSKSNNLYIGLNMKLSNVTPCCLEYCLRQSEFCCDYEVNFNHKNFDYEKSILFSRTANNTNSIIYSYENGILEYTGALNPNSYNVEDISQRTIGDFLNPLIIDSGLIDRYDSIEINNIITTGLNIVDSSLDELINYFLLYDFSEEKKIPYGKIKLLNK